MRVEAVKTPHPLHIVYAFAQKLIAEAAKRPIRQAAVDIFVAHGATESGWYGLARGDGCWNHNAWNHKVSGKQIDAGIDYCERDCGENLPLSRAHALVAANPAQFKIAREYVTPSGTRMAAVDIKAPVPGWTQFQSFESLEVAMRGHVVSLQLGYPLAWEAMLAGDVEAYCRELKARWYFTAEIDVYTKTVRDCIPMVHARMKQEADMKQEDDLSFRKVVEDESAIDRIVRIAIAFALFNGLASKLSGSRAWLEKGARNVAWTCMMTLRAILYHALCTPEDGWKTVFRRGESFGDDYAKGGEFPGDSGKIGSGFDQRLMDIWGVKYGGIGGKRGVPWPIERGMVFCTGSHVGMVCFVEDLAGQGQPGYFRVYTIEGGQVDMQVPVGTDSWELVAGSPVMVDVTDRHMDDHCQPFVRLWKRSADGSIPGMLSVATLDVTGIPVMVMTAKPKPSPAPAPAPAPELEPAPQKPADAPVVLVDEMGLKETPSAQAGARPDRAQVIVAAVAVVVIGVGGLVAWLLSHC